MYKKLILFLMTGIGSCSIHASPLSLNISLIRNLLAWMPNTRVSPYDLQAIALQRQLVTTYVPHLSDMMTALMSPSMRDALPAAPPGLKMRMLALSGNVAKRAKLYRVCVPELIDGRPFEQFPGVMRHIMYEADMGEFNIQEHLPDED